MKHPISDSSSETKTDKLQSAKAPLKVPRVVSLLHRLQRAKDTDGQAGALLDELFFLLEDPPQGGGDRWQKGVELCAGHGIKTSRMAVWRLYHSHVLQWRREQRPLAEAGWEDIAELQFEARLLVAQRVREKLNDPALAPTVLISLAQSETQRQRLELAREMFDDRVKARDRAARLADIKDKIAYERGRALSAMMTQHFQGTPAKQSVVSAHTAS